MTTPPRGPHRRDLFAFYVAVVLIALAGQALAAREWLGWPLATAIPAVAALEFGGVVLSRHALERMRLGERAVAARIGSAAVALFAVTFNWAGHADHRQGGFFAGMSALGYGVWLLDSAARRRDQLRALGMLAEVPPAYGVARWFRHPVLTREARALAIETPSLGLHGSIAAAHAGRRRDRRHAAIAVLLRRKLAEGKDRVAAELAIATYDLDEIAARLAAAADYDGLTALLGEDLTARRVAGVEVPQELPPVAERPSDHEHAEKPSAVAEPSIVPASAPTSGAPATRKRTPAETFRLASALINGDPSLTQTDVADALGISTRRLRDVLRRGREASTGPAEVAPEADAIWPDGPRVPETTAALVAA